MSHGNKKTRTEFVFLLILHGEVPWNESVISSTSLINYTQLQVSVQILELTEMNEPAGEENSIFLSLGISMKLIIFRICLKPRYSRFLWECLWTPSSNHLIYLCSNSTSNTNKQWCLIICFRVSLKRAQQK